MIFKWQSVLSGGDWSFLFLYYYLAIIEFSYFIKIIMCLVYKIFRFFKLHLPATMYETHFTYYFL